MNSLKKTIDVHCILLIRCFIFRTIIFVLSWLHCNTNQIRLYLLFHYNDHFLHFPRFYCSKFAISAMCPCEWQKNDTIPQGASNLREFSLNQRLTIEDKNRDWIRFACAPNLTGCESLCSLYCIKVLSAKYKSRGYWFSWKLPIPCPVCPISQISALKVDYSPLLKI